MKTFKRQGLASGYVTDQEGQDAYQTVRLDELTTMKPYARLYLFFSKKLEKNEVTW